MLRHLRSIFRCTLLFILSFTLSLFAQANGSVSSTAITEGFAEHFTTIWGVAQWLMQAILILTAGIVAFKTATKGQGEDRTKLILDLRVKIFDLEITGVAI
jgi:hypothetical protein